MNHIHYKNKESWLKNLNIIWIDLDEVLSETVDYCIKYNKHKIAWKYVDREDITDYYIYKIPWYNIWKQDAIKWFQDSIKGDKYLEIKPIIWALETLENLKKRWFIFKIVTARIYDIFWKYTENWIDKYYPNIFEDIIYADHFSEKSRKKSELCKENNIKYMIEDNFEYALELAENNIITYLLEKPWNKNIEKTHRNIIKVKSWENINFE